MFKGATKCFFSFFTIFHYISFLWRFVLSLYRAKVVCYTYGTINPFMPHFLGFMLSQLSCLLQSWKGSFPVNFTALTSVSHQWSEHCSIECPNKQQVSFMFVTLNKKCQCLPVSCLCIVIYRRPLIVLADLCRHTCPLTHYSLSASYSEHEGSSERFFLFLQMT